MTFRTYLQRVVSLLARCDDSGGMYRAEVLRCFDGDKETYVLRAIRLGIARGSIVQGTGDRIAMNWHSVNGTVEAVGAATTATATASSPPH